MSTQANITILDINDNSPRFTSHTVFYSWTNDTVIGNVQAIDSDSGSKISYFVGTSSNYIQLDHRTGNLSLNRKYWKLMQLDELELNLGRFKIESTRRIVIMHTATWIKVWEPKRCDSNRPRWTFSFVWNKNHIAKSQFIYQFRVVFENCNRWDVCSI